MRITGQKPISGVQGRGGKRRVGSDGGFFEPDMGSETTASSAMTSNSSIQGMDALLALQELVDEPDRRSKAAKRGHTLLDQLEDLKADLLAGIVSADKLEALANQVEGTLESGDPRIDGVVKEIELRVKVELAKLGRFPS
ncbi:flagellar assembly protein FliX [Roseibium suaedae]|uniref:Class II flagellar assembly regulator n=1 Tax=Roseibium suaedae TaxID=735517 RepID=A0A1M7GIF0_9HYPH|nr:flagellar assembly protein FliX [Roseibium suaedae]SHM15707.1 Class II flagellar assembly regulator [Roseibium suaedae]